MNPNSIIKTIRSGNQKGFTLIEAMVAVAVFAVGILATVSMQTSAIKSNQMARRTTEMTTIAYDLMERLNSLDYNHQFLSSGGHPIIGVEPELVEGDVAFWDGVNKIQNTGIYTFTYTVVQNAPIQNTKTITINVRWTDATGRVYDLGLSRGTPAFQFIKPDTI